MATFTPALFSWDHNTAAANTAFFEIAPPVADKRVRLTSLVYTAAGTVHDLVLMKALAKVAVTTAAAAAATSLILNDASFPSNTGTGTQNLASGDYVIVQHADGTYGAYLVSALATLTITINALAKAVNAEAPLWIMGSPTAETLFHLTFKSIASTRVEFNSAFVGLFESGFKLGTTIFERDGLNDPIMFYSANGTAAGILNWGSGYYV